MNDDVGPDLDPSNPPERPSLRRWLGSRDDLIFKFFAISGAIALVVALCVLQHRLGIKRDIEQAHAALLAAELGSDDTAICSAAFKCLTQSRGLRDAASGTDALSAWEGALFRRLRSATQANVGALAEEAREFQRVAAEVE